MNSISAVDFVQAAAPVGKWVVQQSFKVALGVLTSDAKKQQKK